MQMDVKFKRFDWSCPPTETATYYCIHTAQPSKKTNLSVTQANHSVCVYYVLNIIGCQKPHPQLRMVCTVYFYIPPHATLMCL